MKLDEWDRRIAPRLSRIENITHWLKYDATGLQQAVDGLEARPAWETLARENLNAAELALRTALAVVMAAQDTYDNTRIIIEPFKEQVNESISNVSI